MMLSAVSSLLLAAALSQAVPLNPRLVKLDPAATAEAQQRDNTATRALSNTAIKTSDGQCLFVVSGSGDFRENLTPVQVGPCDGSDGQKWDVITAGVHNDRPGFALIVSSLTQACLNFDPRRAAGNQVILFSCGGRADGGGQVTDSQLFPFDPSKTANVALTPANSNNQVVLTVANGLLDQTAGSPAQASGNELFTFGDAASAPAPAPPAQSSSASAAIPPSATPPPAQTASPTTPVPVSRAGGKLDPSAAAEANQRDDTATRALSGVAIKTNDGNCLTVDATAGDFRENLIPIEAKACDGSAGQQWDFITSGKHNNVAGQTLIVSALTQGCLNFDDRRAAGDQVILFSCGGRADGDGKVTDSQLFAFDPAKTASVPIVPKNGNGKVLFTIANGKLDQSSGSADAASGNQLFTFGDAAAAPAPAPSSSVPAETVPSATPAPPPAQTASPTTPVPVSRAGGRLDPTAAAEANQRDNTATRALSGVAIKTKDGQCLTVDATAGDFRENLIPIEAKACDGSAGQQWDFITSGKHNNVAGQTLIVSALTQGCLNFDDRRAAGDQVILFSCGGRADGDGKVTDSQLFAFDAAKTKDVPIVPKNGQGNVLFTINNGKLDQSSGSAASASGNQLFTFA